MFKLVKAESGLSSTIEFGRKVQPFQSRKLVKARNTVNAMPAGPELGQGSDLLLSNEAQRSTEGFLHHPLQIRVLKEIGMENHVLQ